MAKTIEQRLLDDIAWREDELISLRTIYVRESSSTPKGRGLRRAYLAMLYAHYEGFCKVSWEESLTEIGRCRRPISSLRDSIAIRFICPEMAELRSATQDNFIEAVTSFRVRLLDTVSPTYQKIETSNLWPSVLINVIQSFGMDDSRVQHHSVLLKSLVARRNDIAHGENVGVSDKDLKQLHDAVWDVILFILIDIVEYFSKIAYLK